jgi:hypothetical protein
MSIDISIDNRFESFWKNAYGGPGDPLEELEK